MAVEDLNLLQLSDIEASLETLSDMREHFVSFEEVGLAGLFNRFIESSDEI